MTQLFLPLCLASVVLVFTSAAPTHHEQGAEVDGGHVATPDRCEGIEFDAITPDEKGNQFFFKDGYLWKGFHGPAQLSSEIFSHRGRVDAGFRMHRVGHPEDHDHIYFFQDEMVFRYYNHTLEEGYPKAVGQEFPGVPCHLDAAVECPTGECSADSVIFFKGSEVYHYDIDTQTVKTKTWPDVPPCTSAFRWMEHYYCFHGNNFTRFHPMTGKVDGAYPKDSRHYFMKCPNFGHGGSYQTPKCSEVCLDAITSDDAGKTYIFKGPIYMRLDTSRDGMHAFPMSRQWKEAAGGVDAVFSYKDKIYLIKGEQVYIYRSGAHYTLIEGYPKTTREELGIEGAVDAAFACAGQHTVHIIQGNMMVDVDLSATPRTLSKKAPLPIPKVDAAMCGPNGVQVFSGSQYYQYESPTTLRQSRIRPRPLNITSAMMACQD